MDPNQHPILSIFEENSNIDLTHAFNEIDILRFNKILINLILEKASTEIDVFQVIKTNLKVILDKMNERSASIDEPNDETLNTLNHNRLYCINNKESIDFLNGYQYKNSDLIDFLNKKWRGNEIKKFVYKETDFDLDILETEIIDISDKEEGVHNKKRTIDEVEEVPTQKDDDNKRQKVEEKEEIIKSEQESSEEEKEVRTFRSGRKVTRANTESESKLEDHEKPTQVIEPEEPVKEDKKVKESEPTVRRTLRRGRTRGTVVDDGDEEEEKEKETSPPTRTRRSLRNRK